MKRTNLKASDKPALCTVAVRADHTRRSLKFGVMDAVHGPLWGSLPSLAWKKI